MSSTHGRRRRKFFGCQLTVAAPVEYRPPTPLPNTHFVADAAAAADGADLVMTDVCVSMGDTNGEKRRQDLPPIWWMIRSWRAAAKDAIFMHCLPAHRGRKCPHQSLTESKALFGDRRKTAYTRKKRCWNICFHRRRRERKNKQSGACLFPGRS